MAINKIDVAEIKAIFEQSRLIKYNDIYDIIVYIPNKVQCDNFIKFITDVTDAQFQDLCGFRKDEVILYGDTIIDYNRYDKDTEYAKDINYHLNLILPSVKEGNTVKYACYSTIRQNNIIHYLEPTIFSSFKCFLSLLNKPDYIIVRRVKVNQL